IAWTSPGVPALVMVVGRTRPRRPCTFGRPCRMAHDAISWCYAGPAPRPSVLQHESPQCSPTLGLESLALAQGGTAGPRPDSELTDRSRLLVPAEPTVQDVNAF